MRRTRHRVSLAATGALVVGASIGSACATIAGLESSVPPGPAPPDGATEAEPATDAPTDTGPVTCDPSLCVTAIAADHLHTCVAIRDQPPRCWGANAHGQLGVPDASPDANGVPLVLDLPPVDLIGAGGFVNEPRSFSCAATGDGTLFCWGDDSLGQRARPPGSDAGAVRAVPVMVDAGAAVISLGVGGGHVCAVHPGGEVKCWGLATQGQLGHRRTGVDLVPTRVALPRPALDVAGGSFHTCVLLDDRTVDCFGLNNVQQLAHENPDATGPLVLAGVGRAKHVAMGYAHGCAALEDGTVRCWGHDVYGQLGQGKQRTSGPPAPVLLPAGRSAKAVCAGYLHSCAVLDDDTVACWGSNRRGQIGTGSVLSDETVDPPIVLAPKIVEGVTNVRAVACGGAHTCALHQTGRVTCWGTNEHGQLGRGAADAKPHPEPAEVRF